MLSLILAAYLQAAEPAAQAAPPANPAAAATAPVKPADVSNAIDANGVPSWAKRKRYNPVVSCETKVNIGVETWRGEYDRNIVGRPKLRNAKAVCR
jgi:hypothetical protein